MVGTLKELYEATVESQLKVWDSEIEHLDAMTDIILAQVEDRYYNLIRCLRNRDKELKAQLAELKATCEADAGWQKLNAQLARATHDMRLAINTAAEEIEHMQMV
jgi:hypothetical protein